MPAIKLISELPEVCHLAEGVVPTFRQNFISRMILQNAAATAFDPAESQGGSHASRLAHSPVCFSAGDCSLLRLSGRRAKCSRNGFPEQADPPRRALYAGRPVRRDG